MKDTALIEVIGFTRNEAPGALRNGTRVEKIECVENDIHQVGAKAIVLGSLGPIEFKGDPKMYGYFVEWDDLPGVPCFVAGNRVRELKPN